MIKTGDELSVTSLEDRPYHVSDLLKIGKCVGADHLIICVDGNENLARDYFLPNHAVYLFSEDPEAAENTLSIAGHCIYNFDLSKISLNVSFNGPTTVDI